MSKPISPPIETSVRGGDLPAYVSNGLIGLRVLEIPLRPGVVLISGYAGTHPVVQVEAAAEAPYPLAGDVSLDGVWLTRSPHQATFVDQAYDFSNGELTTHFTFTAGETTATFEVLTFCSKKQPTLLLQEVAVTVNRPADLLLRALVDPTLIHGRAARRTSSPPGKDPSGMEGALCWESLGGKARCGIAYVTELVGDPDAERQPQDWGAESALATDYHLRARPGRTYRMRQIACMVPDVLHHDPDRAATRLVARAAADGFEALRTESRLEWEEIWKGRIVVDAVDDRWQALADAAYFYLNTSVHPSAPSSTSIYGLADWHDYHYYYGHVMWDIELFCVPPLLLVQPDAARSMLEFRTQTIRAARSNAKLLGRRGIQFPWESGPFHGEESAPGIGRASWYEDHISLDIAWAFAQYAHATGDRRFLADDAAPIVYGVSDWIASRVTRTARGFEWLQAMGIAEREQPSDNDAFTIMAARTVLGEAIAVAKSLGQPVPAAWTDTLAGLHVPKANARGAIPTHDRFNPREEKGATPGPLAGLFPLWYPVDPAVEQATLQYYLDLAPQYVGYPMLSALYGTWAAWAGDRRRSAKLFEEGYADLTIGRFVQTLELAPERSRGAPPSGPFFANLGGFLMGLLYGLPGIRLASGDPSTWPARPVVLPAGWRSIEVERVHVRMQPARLVAAHGAERATLEPLPQPRPGTRRHAA